jgi:hypothetical protein
MFRLRSTFVTFTDMFKLLSTFMTFTKMFKLWSRFATFTIMFILLSWPSPICLWQKVKHIGEGCECWRSLNILVNVSNLDKSLNILVNASNRDKSLNILVNASNLKQSLNILLKAPNLDQYVQTSSTFAAFTNMFKFLSYAHTQIYLRGHHRYASQSYITVLYMITTLCSNTTRITIKKTTVETRYFYGLIESQINKRVHKTVLCKRW